MRNSRHAPLPYGAGVILCGVLGLGVPLSGAAAQTPSAPGASDCTLIDSTITTSSRVRPDLTSAFTAYADSGEGWTGGDSTYSIPLADGRNVWAFSDTFLGPVNPDGTRPEETPFLNNSFVVQDEAGLRTATGGTPEEPASLVGPPEDGGWYWIGDGIEDRNGDIQLTALEFWYGGGQWNFGWEANYLATFDADTFALKEFASLPSESGVQWASWIEPAGEYTYVYGVEDGGASKYMHVARVHGPDLKGTWEFWDGSGWSTTETDTARVMDGVSNEYSVAAFGDGYLLITQDTHELFSQHIQAYVSCSPTGPFEPAGTVYDMPETGAFGSYGNGNIIGYNAHEHPELRSGNTTVVSYNVNSLDSQDLYRDVTIYRPRFVELTLDVAPSERTPEVAVDVRSQCVAGRAYVAARATNGEGVPLDVRLASPYGSRNVAGVKVGGNAYQSFASRQASILAGEVTVTAVGDLGNGPATTTVTAPYDAVACG